MESWEISCGGVTEEDWAELARTVGGRGRLGKVEVRRRLEIKNGKEEDLRILWDSTDSEWEWLAGSGGYVCAKTS